MVVAICGQTATGKSALAMELARRYGGEIVCVDSRTVYRGLDIGTATPSPAERAEIPHHMLDVLEPGQFLTAAEFRRRVHAAMRGDTGGRRLWLLVGGTRVLTESLVFELESRWSNGGWRRSCAN